MKKAFTAWDRAGLPIMRHRRERTIRVALSERNSGRTRMPRQGLYPLDATTLTCQRLCSGSRQGAYPQVTLFATERCRAAVHQNRAMRGAHKHPSRSQSCRKSSIMCDIIWWSGLEGIPLEPTMYLRWTAIAALPWVISTCRK